MKRVMVVGGPGSGKTTFALRLAEITGLPVFHMDMIHHLPGWMVRPMDERVEMAHEIEAQEAWVFEGGLSATYANRAARADTAIWLDLPLTLRLFRVYKRRWQYRGGQTRPDLPEDCPEKIDWEFLRWIIFEGRKQRAKIAQALAEAPHLTVHHVRTAKGADTLLEWFRDDYQNND